MNKDEILKKAQQEGNDEMALYIKDKSIKYTYIAMVLAAAVFYFIRDTQGLPMMDLCATVSISVGTGYFYRYAKTKERDALIIGILMLAVTVFATVRFFMGH